MALLLLALLSLSFGVAAQSSMLTTDKDYILTGRPTSQMAPIRACTREMLGRMNESIKINAPAEGWSGMPQAVDVFNVIVGEVMISHGSRTICGNMQDSRTHDSRFRAGIGTVIVPAQGDTEPIRVAWEKPVKANWIPNVYLDASNVVQEQDTERLLVRAACIAIVIALALSALMNYITSRDYEFLSYTIICGLMLVWQSVVSGIGGYPKPWLPIEGLPPWWEVAASAVCNAVMSRVLWRICGGRKVWPRLLPVVRGVVASLLVVALVTPWLSLAALGRVSTALDYVFAAICIMALVAGIVSLRRGDYTTVDGIIVAAPLLLVMLANINGSQRLARIQVEILQLSVTWFLVMYAFGLNRRLGNLRKQRDEMRILADTDALTGLPNRRAGLRQLDNHLAAIRKDERPLSIGLLDVDLFKHINDQFGHEMGDIVLAAVGKALIKSVRSRDDVVRMGGEEFLILLPGLGREAARVRLNDVRREISRRVQELGHKGLSATVSIGLSQARPKEDTMAALLRRADAAMYRAKHNGRDCVVDDADD